MLCCRFRRLAPGYIFLLALLATLTTAQSQTIYGPGGLLLSPTAGTPPRGQITPSVLLLPQASPNLGGRREWVSYGIDYGVTDKLEVGATYLTIIPPSTPFKHGSAGGYIKYQVLTGARGFRPDVAIGGSFLTGGEVNATIGFAALRFYPLDLGPNHPLHLHAGVMYAHKLNGVTRRDGVPYGGIDLQIANDIVVFAEIRKLMGSDPSGASDIKDPWAAGFVWEPVKHYHIVIAYANNGWSNGAKLSVGVGFPIGGER